ncbi:hypothetical protein BT96DRAFT_507709 [Gymnopus androsaceus JB14]|uniref:Protein kinase domain-containing protein n=1 Tax=Gymnopus androsaceus JB14 TaxID=1447944 RepID=A0A6A4GN94_9AGAR|nr:hypothetical protein BT96DRAFT_507709 [Gymnopus androsaceus JB14]
MYLVIKLQLVHSSFQSRPRLDSEDALTLVSTWPQTLPLDSQIKETSWDRYKHQSMRVVVLERLRSIKELGNVRGFFTIYWKILHRDISSSNVMFRRVEGKLYGDLSDFDQSCLVDSVNGVPTSIAPLETIPFMSLDLLVDDEPITQKYRHKLESFSMSLLGLLVGMLLLASSWHHSEFQHAPI